MTESASGFCWSVLNRYHPEGFRIHMYIRNISLAPTSLYQRANRGQPLVVGSQNRPPSGCIPYPSASLFWLTAVHHPQPEIAVHLGIVPLLLALGGKDLGLLGSPAHHKIKDVVEISCPLVSIFSKSDVNRKTYPQGLLRRRACTRAPFQPPSFQDAKPP